MLKIDIIISKNELYKNDKVADYYENSNVLRLTFKSEEDYINFLNNPILTSMDFNEINLKLIPDKVQTILSYSKLYELIKSTTPTFELETINDLPTKVLLTKRKIYLNMINLSLQDTLEILRSPYIHENVTFYDKYNEGKEMSLKDLIEMYNKLLSIIEEVKDKNYSPAESLFYAYNIVKSRIYKKEESHEDETISRSLAEILKCDKIVCAGFANYLFGLCGVLDIPVEKILWTPKNEKKAGHDSIAVYLNDDKYNIHGIFAIDPTWDSKQNEKDTTYQQYIRHFLVPMNIEKNEKAKSNITPNLGCSYYRFLISYDLYQEFPFVDINKNLAFKKARKIFSYMQVSFIEDLDYLYQRLKEMGEQLLDNDTIEQIITTVTPMNDKDLKKTLSSTPYSSQEQQKASTILKRILGDKK